MDPDMFHSSSSTPWTQVAVQSTQISTAPTTVHPSVTNMATGGGPEFKYLCMYLLVVTQTMGINTEHNFGRTTDPGMILSTNPVEMPP